MTGLYPQSQGDLGAIMGSQCTTGPQKRSWTRVEPHIHWTVSAGAVGADRSSHGEQMAIQEATLGWAEENIALWDSSLVLFLSCLSALSSPPLPLPLFFSLASIHTHVFDINMHLKQSECWPISHQSRISPSDFMILYCLKSTTFQKLK